MEQTRAQTWNFTAECAWRLCCVWALCWIECRERITWPHYEWSCCIWCFIFTVVSELSGCSCTVVPSIVSWMKGYAEYVAFPLFFSVFWSPLVFRKTLLCLLVLGITMALHRWDIQEAQSKFILSTTVSGMLEKCDMACHVNRKQPL